MNGAKIMENKKLYLLNELDFLNACGILDSEDVLKKIEVMNNNAILKQAAWPSPL